MFWGMVHIIDGTNEAGEILYQMYILGLLDINTFNFPIHIFINYLQLELLNILIMIKMHVA